MNGFNQASPNGNNMIDVEQTEVNIDAKYGGCTDRDYLIFMSLKRESL